MSPRITEYPRPSQILVQISDTHFTGDGSPLYGAMDGRARVRDLLERLAGSGLRPDALVFSGDLADRGEAQAYRDLAAMVEPVAERLGAPVLWCVGNHDRRGPLREILLGGEASDDPVDYVTWLGELRVIVLDSSIPDSSLGQVTDAQLGWLAGQLAAPAPAGTVLVMHHPPMPTVQDMAVTCELVGQAALADVVRGTDVRLILSGHVHYSTFATFAGIPVAAAASAAYTQDLFMPERGTRGRDAAQGLNLIECYADTTVVTAFPLVAGEAVGRTITGAESARLLATDGLVFRPAPQPASTAAAGRRDSEQAAG